ncbi:monocarboxylate transporter 12-like [Glandiceps talaboti]
MVGGVICSIGILLSSFATSVSMLCFTYGFLTGFGLGLVYSPSIGMLSFYFDRRYALANGLANMGSGFGIFIFPPILHLLIEQYGWRGAFLVLSALSANICVCSTVFREPKTDVTSCQGLHGDELASEKPSTSSNESTNIVHDTNQNLNDKTKSDICDRNEHTPANETRRQSHGKKRGQHTKYRIKKLLTMFELNLFRESGLFVLMFVSCFFQGLGLYMGVIYLLPRAESKDIASSRDNTFLVSIMGIFGIIGRGGHGFLLECKYITGPSLYAISLVIGGVVSLLSGFANTFVTYAAVSAMIGLTSGTYVPLVPVFLAEFTAKEKMTGALALCKLSLGAGLVGTPIAGWMYDSTRNYDYVFYFAGISLCVGGFMILLMPYLKRVETRRRTIIERGSNRDECHVNATFDERNENDVII